MRFECVAVKVGGLNAVGALLVGRNSDHLHACTPSVATTTKPVPSKQSGLNSSFLRGMRLTTTFCWDETVHICLQHRYIP